MSNKPLTGREWTMGLLSVLAFMLGLAVVAINEQLTEQTEAVMRAESSATIWKNCRAPKAAERLVVTADARRSGEGQRYTCVYNTGGFFVNNRVREVQFAKAPPE